MKEKYKCKYRMMSRERIKRDLILRTIEGGFLSGLSFGITIGTNLRWMETRPVFAFLVSIPIMFIISFYLSFIKGWWVNPSGKEVLEALGLEVNSENMAKYDYFPAYFLGPLFVFGTASAIVVFMDYPTVCSFLRSFLCSLNF